MSRQYFDFSSLIMDYTNPFYVIKHGAGHYDAAGDWQEGKEVKTELRGAIISFKESRVLRSEGAITSKDKRLFMRKRLSDDLIGAEVIHSGQKYKIESETENAEFTGVYSYLLRWVSAFD